jgi:ribonuclease P protein component
MVLLVVGNEQTESRFGIVAGRTVGGAVQRNRAKRLLRAALQPRLLGIKPGWDVVLLARHGMSATTFTQTQSALEALLRRAGITNESLNVLRS